MELVLNITEKNKIDLFLNLIKEFSFVELVSVNDNEFNIPENHRELLDQRIQSIDSGGATFRSWDVIKPYFLQNQ